MQQNFEEFKAKRRAEDVDLEPEEEQPKFDAQTSIVNFLATVAEEAERQKIDYERLFAVESQPAPPQPAPPLPFKESPVPQEEALSLTLRQIEDMLIRTLNKEPNAESYTLPSTDYLDYRRRRVSTYYFGSDDEGDYKDLKKTVSNSFKKFQQTNRSSILLD